MAETDLRAVVLGCLQAVAPEANLADLDPARTFNEQIEIDSVDYLNFVFGIEEALGVRIAEADYPKLSSLNGCLAVLSGRAKQPGDCPAP